MTPAGPPCQGRVNGDVLERLARRLGEPPPDERFRRSVRAISEDFFVWALPLLSSALIASVTSPKNVLILILSAAIPAVISFRSSCPSIRRSAGTAPLPDLLLRLSLQELPRTLSVYVVETIPRDSADRLNSLVDRLTRHHADAGMPAAVLLLGGRSPALWTAHLGFNAHGPGPLRKAASATFRDPPATGPWWSPTREAIAALWADHPDHRLSLHLILETLTGPPYEWDAGLPPPRLGRQTPPAPAVVQVEASRRTGAPVHPFVRRRPSLHPSCPVGRGGGLAARRRQGRCGSSIRNFARCPGRPIWTF